MARGVQLGHPRRAQAGVCQGQGKLEESNGTHLKVRRGIVPVFVTNVLPHVHERKRNRRQVEQWCEEGGGVPLDQASLGRREAWEGVYRVDVAPRVEHLERLELELGRLRPQVGETASEEARGKAGHQ